MGFLRSPSCRIPLVLVILTVLELDPQRISATDLTTVVYKGCARQALSDPTGAYPQALSSLYSALVAQSSKARFFKTTSGSGQARITGLFQCRGDLTSAECYSCVSRLPALLGKFCGRDIAARVHLLGCYMLYEVAGFAQISGMELLYKSCGKADGGAAGFVERRDAALASLENGMIGSNGFSATSYEAVYVLGQCQGDLGASDCVKCVKSAVQRARVGCGSSFSGQLYLHKCYISYSYYPKGIPRKSNPDSDTSPSSGSESNTGKIMAIILGAAAGVALLIIFLLFARGLMKRKDDYY